MLSRSLRPIVLKHACPLLWQPRRGATVIKRVNLPLTYPVNTGMSQIEIIPNESLYYRVDVVDKDDEAETFNKPVRVILLKSLEDYGKVGQILSVPREKALKDLLLVKFAVYASPENLEKYKSILIPEGTIRFSSEYVKKVYPTLTRTCFPIIMNSHHKWRLENVHVQCALRRHGLQANDASSIKLPDEIISGPDFNLEGKEFPIWVKINSFEEVPLRCILFHWSSDDIEVTACPPPGWDIRFNEPMFESHRELLKMLPRKNLDPSTMTHLLDRAEITTKYNEWKKVRDQILFS